MSKLRATSLAVCALVLSYPLGSAVGHAEKRSTACHVIIPHCRSYGFNTCGQPAVRVATVEATVEMRAAAATTSLKVHLQNMTGELQQAELVWPVPDEITPGSGAATVADKSLVVERLSGNPAGEYILELVKRAGDPAPVEFLGRDLLRTSVLALEGGAAVQVCLSYSQPLHLEDNRLDYVLPRSESLQYELPWDISVTIDANQPLSTAYSPSHHIRIHRESATRLSIRNQEMSRTSPGPFRLSALIQTDDLTGSVFAFPDSAIGGGYFLLLMGLPAEPASDANTVNRELTLVLDRSGSMAGRKVEQAKAAAAQVISGLQEDEAFNLIIYNSVVEHFSSEPLLKTPENEDSALQFISGIHGTGMTDIYSALQQALLQEPVPGMLPLILFLTDGLPTAGQTNETAIRNLAVTSNPHNRRIYTFGVGYDLNAPLLDALAELSRGQSTFVLPSQDVDSVVAQVFGDLSSPIVTDTDIRVCAADGAPAPDRVLEILPLTLPELFGDDQLVLLGRYVGDSPLVFELSGHYLGAGRTFRTEFDPHVASTQNTFVPTLWAARMVATQIDEARQLAADPSFTLSDPRLVSLALTTVGVSIQFGIVTEYTSILAEQDADLADYAAVIMQTMMDMYDRTSARSGIGAVNQSINLAPLRCQSVLNPDNRYFDQRMRETRILTVQHVHDITFYYHQNIWTDSRIVTPDVATGTDVPIDLISFGDDEYFEIAERWARQDRQGGLAFADDVVLWDNDRLVVIVMPGTSHIPRWP